MWTVITKGTVLPANFVQECIINRDDYIIEFGFAQEDKWYDEYMSSAVSLEVIGAITVGSNMYNDVRYRLRTSLDNKWDITKTQIAKIISKSVR